MIELKTWVEQLREGEGIPLILRICKRPIAEDKALLKKESLFLSSRIIVAVLLFQFFSLQTAMAQQSFVFNEAYPEFREGLELFQKEKFLPAQENFQNTMNAISDRNSEIHIDAQYFHAVCAVNLFHDDAEILLTKFIEEHPENNRLTSAYLNLAKYQFRKKSFKKVIAILTQLDPLDLNSDERAEYYFKLAYAYLQEGEKEKAAQKFYEIKDTDNRYVNAARYYYAHLAYESGKYQSALEDFVKIEKDPQFGPLVPYYLTQIYYMQEKYVELLAYAPAVLDSAPPKREIEIKKLIGDAYYETGQYQEAIPYLKEYNLRRSPDQEDHYQLGYAYFKAEEYESSVRSFQKAVGEDDSLSQSAYYYIGSAGLKAEQKAEARAAFKMAAEFDQDKELQEDALFNYAKLAYELSYHPYDDAIIAFEQFIEKYPNSPRLDNAYEYLLGVYYTTKNYEEALKSIDRINSKDLRLLDAKQRIAYYRGVELFNQGKFIEALDLFTMSLKINRDPVIKAKATYWMAESFHILGDYDNAINFYTDFLSASGSRSIPYFERAYYNLAYSHYEKGKFASAVFWFKEYIDKENPQYKGLINDAYLRIGDSYFVRKEYKNAIDAYDKAVRLNIANTDYSLLQLAISQGLLGDYKAKVQTLKKLVNEQKASIYTDDALSELGKTYMVLNMNDDALAYYNQLITDYPNSTFLAEAYLKIGLIYYNNEQDDLALNSFDRVIDKYPSTHSAKEALEKVRKIFIDKGDLQAFEDYINGVPFADISKSKLDSTAYVIAENHYLAGKCDKAVRDLTNYLKRYPSGLFSLNAHYYRGDCEARQGFQQEAVFDFEYVVAQPANKFTEKSLNALGRIYQSMDSNRKAIANFERLLKIAETKSLSVEAEERLLRLYFKMEKLDEAEKMARQILLRNPINPEIWQQANLIIARVNFKKENYGESLKYLDSLSNISSVKGAEAKYITAKIFYLQGRYAKSDTMIYTLVDQVPSSPYWIAKGFILLADNFIAKEDYYNARITFQSVIDNADNVELVAIAKEKLEILTKNEKKQSEDESKQPEPIEIDLNANGSDQNEDTVLETDSLPQLNSDSLNVQPKEVNDED